MNKDQIIFLINDMPVDQRIEIAAQILQSFHEIDPDIEKAWTKEARKRLDDFEQGIIEAIPGDQVHKQLRDKYSK